MSQVCESGCLTTNYDFGKDPTFSIFFRKDHKFLKAF